MSLLTQQNQQSDEQLLQRRIQEIKSSPRRLAEMMYQQWEQSFNALWTEGKFTVAQKLEAVSTDAAELFELNSTFVTFMITQLTGKRDDLVQKIQEKVATIPEHTINEDGTVTLD
jgi:flagellar biosynthesis GTPase FlhF